MKTAISIPDSVFEAAEELAQRLGISRSRLYSQAVQRLLSDYRRQDVTERLDEIYLEESAWVDPVLETLQIATLEDEDW